MKKNKNIFMASVLLLSLGLASCTDSFLDVTSKTESSTGTFYKTEKDAYRALIGCYDGWRQTSSAMMVGFYMASEVMSAECFGATGNADGRGYQAIDRFDISQSPADLNLYEGDWKNYYAGVYLIKSRLYGMNRIANVVSIWANVVRCVHCFIWIWFVYGGISHSFWNR